VEYLWRKNLTRPLACLIGETHDGGCEGRSPPRKVKSMSSVELDMLAVIARMGALRLRLVKKVKE
jgi:hypothetical protein